MAEILNSLVMAIIAHYNDFEPDYKFSGGLYFMQAKQGTTGNWVTFNYDGGDGDEIMGGADDVIENSEIRFNLFTDADDGGMTLASMMERLTGGFDWQRVTVQGFNTIKVQRTATAPVLYIDNIWQVAIIYEFSLQKN